MTRPHGVGHSASVGKTSASLGDVALGSRIWPPSEGLVVKFQPMVPSIDGPELTFLRT